MNTPKAPEKQNKVFVCYSHKDEKYLERLRVHFSPLSQQGVIEFWADINIRSGEEWEHEIQKALDESTVAILLISADFFASDFIRDVELPRILAAREERELVVLVVHAAPSNYKHTMLTGIQGVNDPEDPLMSMREDVRERLFVKLVDNVQTILDQSIFDLESTARVHRGNDAGLTELPKEVLKKKNLTTLYLSGNKLSELPAEFESLTKLTVLYLNRNQFKEIPAVIFKLPRLKELYFSNNQIGSIPSDIIKLEQLKMLRLSSNRLGRVPSEIGWIKTLKELYLGNNRIEYLPSELGNLEALNILDVSNNKLVALPAQLKQVNTLKQLFLHGNAFPKIEDLERFGNEPKKIFDRLFE